MGTTDYSALIYIGFKEEDLEGSQGWNPGDKNKAIQWKERTWFDKTHHSAFAVTRLFQ